jgi:hypothetical protein
LSREARDDPSRGFPRARSPTSSTLGGQRLQQAEPDGCDRYRDATLDPELVLDVRNMCAGRLLRGRTETGNVVSSQRAPRARRQLPHNLRPSLRECGATGRDRVLLAPAPGDWPEPRLLGIRTAASHVRSTAERPAPPSQRHAQPKQPERDGERAGQDGRPGYHQRPAPLLEPPDATPLGCQPEDLEQRHHYHQHGG